MGMLGLGREDENWNDKPEVGCVYPRPTSATLTDLDAFARKVFAGENGKRLIEALIRRGPPMPPPAEREIVTPAPWTPETD